MKQNSDAWANPTDSKKDYRYCRSRSAFKTKRPRLVAPSFGDRLEAEQNPHVYNVFTKRGFSKANAVGTMAIAAKLLQARPGTVRPDINKDIPATCEFNKDFLPIVHMVFIFQEGTFQTMNKIKSVFLMKYPKYPLCSEHTIPKLQVDTK